jgi:catechol 2,3-dioxygenase
MVAAVDAGSIFRPRRIGHANITIHDIEQGRQFFGRVCGLEQVHYIDPVEAYDSLSASFYSNGNTHHDIAIVQATDGRPPGLSHLGLELESEYDLVKAISRLAEAGIPVSLADHKMAHSAYVKDPDGLALEFYADFIHNWREFWQERDGKHIGVASWTVPTLDGASKDTRYWSDPPFRVVEDALFHVKCIRAAVVGVRDLTRSLDFYQNVAGFTLLEQFELSDSDGSGETKRAGAIVGGALGNSDLVLAEVEAGDAGELRSLVFELMTPAPEPALRDGSNVEFRKLPGSSVHGGAWRVTGPEPWDTWLVDPGVAIDSSSLRLLVN